MCRHVKRLDASSPFYYPETEPAAWRRFLSRNPTRGVPHTLNDFFCLMETEERVHEGYAKQVSRTQQTGTRNQASQLSPDAGRKSGKPRQKKERPEPAPRVRAEKENDVNCRVPIDKTKGGANELEEKEARRKYVIGVSETDD